MQYNKNNGQTDTLLATLNYIDKLQNVVVTAR